MSDDNWIPEGLRDAPYFKTPEGGEPRTLEGVLSDLAGAAAMQGDMSKTHIKIPDKADTTSVSVAMQKAMESIPGMTVIPTGDDAEADAAFWKSMGRPESADKYKAPEGIAADVNLDPIREQALAYGWTQKQFDSYVGKMGKDLTDASEARQDVISANIAELKVDWGAAYDDRHKMVGEFLSSEGVPADILAAFKSDQLAPASSKWLYAMAQAVSGEDMQIGDQGSTHIALTPEDAREQIEAFKPEYYAMKNTDPGFKAAKAKMHRLMLATRGRTAA